MFGKLAKGSEAPRPCCSLRPCLADGKPATFHLWVRYDEERLQLEYLVRPEQHEAIVRHYRETGVCGAGCRLEKVQQVAALVEYADGSVGKVKPELITFLDRKEG